MRTQACSLDAWSRWSNGASLVGLDLQDFEALGYCAVADKGAAGICGLQRMAFTGAIVVGITLGTYRGRYCYASMHEAAIALAEWDGQGNPGGLRLKFKGINGERHGPGLVAAVVHA